MKLYNTLTRQKEEFVPITPGEVKMYSCGPTVYNYFHVGNARPFIIFDLLRCYLEYRGYKVEFVQNFTDIDDKVINKANEEGVDFNTIAERYIKEYYVDAQGLGVKKASVHPRATETMDAIIDIGERLIENGHAYVAENGDVYFRTKSFPEYGKLCHQPMEELQAGARISVGEVKEDPMDFAVWKAAKPGEPAWDTPWGSKGRPGWHIECSAMANKYLGKTIDIHSGGLDLIFPHHENENRAVRVRKRLHLRALLAAQRLPDHRQREDVQVQGQFLHGSRRREAVRLRNHPYVHAVGALPHPAQLLGRVA